MYTLWRFPCGEDAGAIHLRDAVTHKHFVPLEAGGATCATALDVWKYWHHVSCLHVYQHTQINGHTWSSHMIPGCCGEIGVGGPTLWACNDPRGEDVSSSKNSTATLSADNNLWAELLHTSEKNRETRLSMLTEHIIFQLFYFDRAGKCCCHVSH